MLRPSPNHGTQRLPNDDDDVLTIISILLGGSRPPPRFWRGGLRPPPTPSGIIIVSFTSEQIDRAKCYGRGLERYGS